MKNQGKDEDRLLEMVGQIKEKTKNEVIQQGLDVIKLLEEFGFRICPFALERLACGH